MEDHTRPRGHSENPRSSCQQNSRQLETKCGREDHTRPRGPRKSPDGVDSKTSGWASKRTRKTQRDGHNSGVKIWSLCSVSSILSHANPWATLSNPCNKVRGKYIWKEVFLRPSFLRFPSWVLYSCVCYHCVGMYPVYICMQHILICCMCQQNSSRIQNEPGYRKRQFLSITTWHQRKGQRKMLELKEVKKRKKQEQTSNKKEEGERNRPMRKEQKKRRKEKREKEKKIL